MDQMNFELTYATVFNLACQYQANEMDTEAINTYSVIVKGKQYANAGRLRVNMGNIYFKQKKYVSAIKMYRMAMDQIGSVSPDIKYCFCCFFCFCFVSNETLMISLLSSRFRIMRNIGNAFLRLRQYQDAIQSYEAIMETAPDYQTGFNLIVCYYALGSKELMKRGFIRLLGIGDVRNSLNFLFFIFWIVRSDYFFPPSPSQEFPLEPLEEPEDHREDLKEMEQEPDQLAKYISER